MNKRKNISDMENEDEMMDEIMDEMVEEAREEVQEEVWEETEQSTIMDAFIFLTRDNEDEAMRHGNRTHMHLDQTDNNACRYLMRRLNMTRNQIHLLACIMYHTQGIGQACDADDITGYLDAHPLAIFSMRQDFDALIKSGYLEENTGFGKRWQIRKEASKALSENRTLDLNEFKVTDTLALLAECINIIREGRHHDSDDEIENRIDWLFIVNEDLPFVKNVYTIAGGDPLIEKTLVLAAARIVGEEVPAFNIGDLNMILSSQNTRTVGRALQRGNFPPVRQGLLEPYCSSEGMANADQWTISKEGWMKLLDGNTEEMEAILNIQKDPFHNLTPSSEIKERKLFFSGKTRENVDRLRAMLQEEQYQQIVAKLKEKNMPSGLNILLYGTPGTGKTELVQQLARETGRDLFVVDMALIRDKYVGESEQNLTRIFNNYRSYVERMPKAPILFCNECDAIFGSRMERTEHAVDKMENAMQNILLEQMEKMPGIMICTTNLTSTLDKAFERRFLMKLQLPKPELEARKLIWQSMLPQLNEEQCTALANRFDFSGGQIQNVTRKQIINSIFTGNDELDFNRILDDCSAESMDRSNGHKIGF